MTRWSQVPALQFAVALAAGIAVGHLALEGPHAPLAVGTLAAVSLALQVWPVALHYRGLVRTTGLLLLFAALGTFLGARTGTPVVGAPGGPEVEHLVVELTAPLKPGAKWQSTEGDVVGAYLADRWVDTTGRIRLALAPAYADSALGPGATLVTRAAVREVGGPRNPHGFDFRAYLARRGLSHQAFVKAGEARVLRPADRPTPVARLRAAIARRIDLALPTPAEAAVARALLLGDKSAISADVREAYTRTGAVHVLAVSGLHTGVIAAILVWVIGRFGSGRRGGFVRLLALWGGLFAYVALTGYAASVSRSALMFGLLYAGRLVRRDASAFNSLGLSALILLALQPDLLFELGFQLSYLAVAGILAFYPVLHRYLRSGNPYVNFLGDLVAVSIAATLATAPLTVYHFHQFPVYFLLSGAVAVPLVSLALPCLLAGLAVDGLCSLLGGSAYWAYVPAYLLVWMCNAVLALIAELPAAVAEALWPSVRSTVLALAGVLAFGLLATSRRPVFFALASGLTFALALSLLGDRYSQLRTTQLITYATRGAAATDFAQSGHVQTLGRYRPDAPTLLRAAQPNRDALGVLAGAPETALAYLPDTARFAAFAAGGRRWIELPPQPRNPPPKGGPIILAPDAPAVDFVVVHETRRTDPARLAAAFPAATLVTTDYIPSWRAEQWAAVTDRTWVLPQRGARIHYESIAPLPPLGAR